MSFPSANLANAVKQYKTCRNATGTAIPAGSWVQWDLTGTDGITVKTPATTGLLLDCAGVLEKELGAYETSNNCLVHEGVVACRFTNHASAAAGTFVTPVNSSNVATYSASDTGILLLTDQTSGTAAHGPDEGADAPKVWLMPNRFKRS